MLKLIFLSYFIFLGLFFTGPNLLAQTENSESAAQAQPQIQEEHDTQNLDKLLIDYNKDQEKVLQDSEKINQKDNANELSNNELETSVTPEPPAFELATKKMDPSTLKKMKYADALRIALDPLQKMSEAELVNLLKENTKGSSSEILIKKYPKIALCAVRLIKDKDALPGLAKIIDDQERLIQYAGAMISTILLAILLKRYFYLPGRSVQEAVGFWFLRFLIIFFLRIGILYSFYSSELAATFKVVTKTFF